MQESANKIVAAKAVSSSSCLDLVIYRNQFLLVTAGQLMCSPSRESRQGNLSSPDAMSVPGAQPCLFVVFGVMLATLCVDFHGALTTPIGAT